MSNNTKQPCALVMAGGTGGHIFPGLAVATALRDAGWRVHWLGGTGTPGQASMESVLVPAQGFAFDAVAFSGFRGKGMASQVWAPFRLLRACVQSAGVLRHVQPDVVVGMGGYITVPGGLMARLLGMPILLHEQNSVAGMANKLLARMSRRVYSSFPDVLPQARWIGNPLRSTFVDRPEPAARFAARRGPLRMLVLGGSLGAQALNDVVPKALAMIPLATRPLVLHQSGKNQIAALQANYTAAGVQGELVPFIDDTAQAMMDADLVLCRAGASTVTEIAAIGAAAVFVPFPQAVDDHQTTNARFLADPGAGWLVQQKDLTPDRLARMLQKADRPTLMATAMAARKLAKTGATETLVKACQKLVKPGGAA
jgi:UDP-N-acetylglucosamine--N-acetylmuramyl-(pentapeptide) pyrophosphoryl-undecaprenol N-acetylglucosamine transferase